MSALPRLVPPVFRPPSEAYSLILQLTLGCSWNRCTYCAMYRSKSYRVRPLEDVLEEIRSAAEDAAGVRRVFLADGDALAAPFDVLRAVLEEIRLRLPSVNRVGIYGDSRSILALEPEELDQLRRLGLGIIYFGPESGDGETLRRIRKGATVERQVEAARRVRAAGLKLSMMILLGVAGRERSEEHARASGIFIVETQPNYAAALTLTPVEGTELYEAVGRGDFELPDRWGMLRELRWMLEEMDGYHGLFHANHASNYLPLKLRMPKDREAALEMIDKLLRTRDEALLRPEWARGL